MLTCMNVKLQHFWRLLYDDLKWKVKFFVSTSSSELEVDRLLLRRGAFLGVGLGAACLSAPSLPSLSPSSTSLTAKHSSILSPSSVTSACITVLYYTVLYVYCYTNFCSRLYPHKIIIKQHNNKTTQFFNGAIIFEIGAVLQLFQFIHKYKFFLFII